MRAAPVATAMRKKSYRKIQAKRGFSASRASSPSPRLRGEGRGEGASPQGWTLAEGEGAFPRSSDSRRGPLTRNLREERANSDLSPQAGRGKGPACDERSDSLLLPAAIRS